MWCVSNAFIKNHEKLTLSLMQVCIQSSDSPCEPHNATKIYKHIYLYMHMYIYMCHQIVRIVYWHKAQHELFQMVFRVQHSYLDTSTPKTDYIITFLGLWELCFAWKTIHTSWPSFSLVSKMSENRQVRLQ